MLATCVACRVDRFHSPAVTARLGAFMVLYLLFAVGSYYLVGEQTQERWDIVLEMVTLLTLAVIYYGFGVAVVSRNIGFALWVAFVVTSVHSFSSQDMFTSEQLWLRSQAGFRTAYQYAGDAFAILSLLLLGLTKGAIPRVVLILVATVVLFIIPSRSSALLGIAAILSWSLLFAGKRTSFLLAASVCLAAWYLGFFSLANLEDTFRETRFATLVSGEEDTSKSGRDSVALTGYEIIGRYFFTGKLGFQVDRFGEAGMYVHNALDIWAQTGIVPFAAFVILWLSIVWRMINVALQGTQPLERFFGVVVFAALSWMFTRHTHVSLLYFCLGIVSAHLAGKAGRRRTWARSGKRRNRRRGGLAQPIPAAAPENLVAEGDPARRWSGEPVAAKSNAKVAQ